MAGWEPTGGRGGRERFPGGQLLFVSLCAIAAVLLLIAGVDAAGTARLALLVIGGLLGVLCALAGVALLAESRVAITRQTDGDRVLGVGPGPYVHVLPYWDGLGGFHAELWLDGHDAPLGRVQLAPVDGTFDPSLPFRAWGPLQPGGPVALTSADDRQVLVPRSVLMDPLPPGDPGPVTLLLSDLLGWPNRVRPAGGGDQPGVHAAIGAFRTRGRRLAPAGVIISSALAVPFAALIGEWPFGLVVLAMAAAGGVPLVAFFLFIRAPIHRLLAPRINGDQALRRKAARSLLNTWVGGAHAPGAAADGGGWTPRPHPPAPR